MPQGESMFAVNPNERALAMYREDVEQFARDEMQLPSDFYDEHGRQMKEDALSRIDQARSLAVAMSTFGESGAIQVGNVGSFTYEPQSNGAPAIESVVWSPVVTNTGEL